MVHNLMIETCSFCCLLAYCYLLLNVVAAWTGLLVLARWASRTETATWATRPADARGLLAWLVRWWAAPAASPPGPLPTCTACCASLWPARRWAGLPARPLQLARSLWLANACFSFRESTTPCNREEQRRTARTSKNTHQLQIQTTSSVLHGSR